MAIINTSETSGTQGRPNLPKAVRSLRIIKVEKLKSKSGKDMILFQYEIVSPESEVINGVPTPIAGLQLSDYIVFGTTSNIPVERLSALTKLCAGNPMVDIENPALLRSNYLGKCVRAEVKTEIKPLMQKDEAGVDQPVLDDNGQVINDNNYRLGRFIGTDAKFTIPAEMMNQGD